MRLYRVSTHTGSTFFGVFDVASSVDDFFVLRCIFVQSLYSDNLEDESISRGLFLVYAQVMSSLSHVDSYPIVIYFVFFLSPHEQSTEFYTSLIDLDIW